MLNRDPRTFVKFTLTLPAVEAAWFFRLYLRRLSGKSINYIRAWLIPPRTRCFFCRSGISISINTRFLNPTRGIMDEGFEHRAERNRSSLLGCQLEKFRIKSGKYLISTHTFMRIHTQRAEILTIGQRSYLFGFHLITYRYLWIKPA